MKIALVSLDQVWENKKANQLKCQNYIEQAAKLNVEFIVFPEMTLTGFSMNTQLIGEKTTKSPTIDFFSHQAKLNNIAIALGVVFEKENKATNNLVIIDNKGNPLTSYEKIHPFSYSGENEHYLGGDVICTCEIADLIIGLTICYDLRFPEIFQALSKNCSLILTIANWPEKRIAHWNTLLQARAIENQCFIVGVNRTGTDGNNHKYIKSSMIFDPSGEKLYPIQTYLDLDIYELSINKILSVRSSFPMKQDRRTELYKSIL